MDTLMKLVTKDHWALLEDGTVLTDGWVMGRSQLCGKQEWTLPHRVESRELWGVTAWSGVRHRQS